LGVVDGMELADTVLEIIRKIRLLLYISRVLSWFGSERHL